MLDEYNSKLVHSAFASVNTAHHDVTCLPALCLRDAAVTATSGPRTKQLQRQVVAMTRQISLALNAVTL